jgi:2-keto-3-deoxy-L-rhamnonate aldolase RhmA
MNRLHQAVAKSAGRPLLGAALYSYDPVFLEIAAHMGFQVIWIEMEHVAISFAQAADLCRMAAGTGMLTMIRIPDTRRDSVLKAAECGPDMIDIPMADTPEDIAALVRYAKFTPAGARGIFSVSRALKYGIVDNIRDEQQKINSNLTLLAQIETKESLARIEEITAIPDVDIFIGPADLAASLGIPGQTAHPKLLEAAEQIVRASRKHGKKIATACPITEFSNWTHLGIDLLFCTNNINCLKAGAKLALEAAEQAIAATPKATDATTSPR